MKHNCRWLQVRKMLPCLFDHIQVVLTWLHLNTGIQSNYACIACSWCICSDQLWCKDEFRLFQTFSPARFQCLKYLPHTLWHILSIRIQRHQYIRMKDISLPLEQQFLLKTPNLLLQSYCAGRRQEVPAFLPLLFLQNRRSFVNRLYQGDLCLC